MENQEKKKRVRSPNYPVIDLSKALGLTETLFNNQTRYLVSVDIAAKDWGITPKSSYLSQSVAALASYGLIDTEGEKDSRKVKISDLAFKIIIDKRPDSEERKTLIRNAALTPYIFRKIFDKYQSGLPVDHTLEYELQYEFKFNPASVNEFIIIMKKTFDFANIYKSGILEEEKITTGGIEIMQIDKQGIKDGASAGKIVVPPPPLLDPREREIATYTIGRGLKARILISGDQPTTKESIEKFLKRLKEDTEYLIENTTDEKSEPNEN